VKETPSGFSNFSLHWQSFQSWVKFHSLTNLYCQKNIAIIIGFVFDFHHFQFLTLSSSVGANVFMVSLSIISLEIRKTLEALLFASQHFNKD
jgi:hypothetical protein